MLSTIALLLEFPSIYSEKIRSVAGVEPVHVPLCPIIVKSPLLVAVQPCVTAILPVFAPLGTVAVMVVALTTV